jgi:hypothetical protein
MSYGAIILVWLVPGIELYQLFNPLDNRAVFVRGKSEYQFIAIEKVIKDSDLAAGLQQLFSENYPLITGTSCNENSDHVITLNNSTE